ncbi:MAG: ABC transporter ATP-binding protein [Candidatus Sumerlaeia bacterium]
MFLRLDNLTVRFGRRTILDGLTCSADAKALGLLGPNGAGKSTLIRTLLGFIRPAAGQAFVAGLDTQRDSRAIRALVGYMPEHESFIHGLSPVKLLRFMGELCGMSPRDAMERAHEVLYYVGLGEVRYRNVETFSLGMQQKVKLAQALVHGPRLLILDEPTNALDPEGRREMLNLIRDIVHRSDSHVILCSHILKDVEFCCDEVMVLHRGRLALQGRLDDLRLVDSGVFDLRLKGPAERFMAAVAEAGCACSQGPRGTLRVVLADGQTPSLLFRLARETGVQLRHFDRKRDSLEDIFIQAIEDSEREDSIHAGV